jgi:hypothetical protein
MAHRSVLVLKKSDKNCYSNKHLRYVLDKKFKEVDTCNLFDRHLVNEVCRYVDPYLRCSECPGLIQLADEAYCVECLGNYTRKEGEILKFDDKKCETCNCSIELYNGLYCVLCHTDLEDNDYLVEAYEKRKTLKKDITNCNYAIVMYLTIAFIILMTPCKSDEFTATIGCAMILGTLYIKYVIRLLQKRYNSLESIFDIDDYCVVKLTRQDIEKMYPDTEVIW